MSVDWSFLSSGWLIDNIGVDILCWLWDKESLFKVKYLWIYTLKDSV